MHKLSLWIMNEAMWKMVKLDVKKLKEAFDRA